MTTLRVRGEVDLTTREAFENLLRTDDRDLTIDLHDLRFIDAAGLRALARASHRHELRLLRPSSHLRRLLTLVGLDHLVS
ncbi:STAS domain-containing protein [Actinoplanes bogorensis]|uniref:STAS domain-containing protein n=1 Tax=Paractinoplanes bogorensis TaxID=1610840 RepID=A0ABS5YKN3_9ACTN|nr:STAS domain-containing protein [Actinoplanes bogorensis]MBU2663982.1 STAS domain-containing protein [Actinoplanes bogorensis]